MYRYIISLYFSNKPVCIELLNRLAIIYYYALYNTITRHSIIIKSHKNAPQQININSILILLTHCYFNSLFFLSYFRTIFHLQLQSLLPFLHHQVYQGPVHKRSLSPHQNLSFKLSYLLRISYL